MFDLETFFTEEYMKDLGEKRKKENPPKAPLPPKKESLLPMGVMTFEEFEEAHRKELEDGFSRWGLPPDMKTLLYPAIAQNVYAQYLSDQKANGNKLPPIPKGAMSFKEFGEQNKRIIDGLMSRNFPPAYPLTMAYGDQIFMGLMRHAYHTYLTDLEEKGKTLSKKVEKAMGKAARRLRDITPASDTAWLKSFANDIYGFAKNSPVGKVVETGYDFGKQFPSPLEAARYAYERYFGNHPEQPQTDQRRDPRTEWIYGWDPYKIAEKLQQEKQRKYREGNNIQDVRVPASVLLEEYQNGQPLLGYLPKESEVHFGQNGTYISVPGTKSNPKELRLMLDNGNLYFAKQDTENAWKYLQKIPVFCPNNTNPVEFYMTAEKMVDYFRNMPPEKVGKYREHFKAWISHSDEIFTLGSPDKMFDGFMKVADKWEKSLKETPAKTKAPTPKGKEPGKKATPAPAKRTGTTR